MPEREGSPHSEDQKNAGKETAKRIGLHVPDILELTQASIETLHQQWTRNHAVLLHYIQQAQFPFFGLHGTSEEHWKQITAQQKGHFEMATFYEKSTQEQFLYQLYDMINYAMRYATREGRPGVLMIFHLEKAGNNSTHPWKHLLPSSMLGGCLTRDNKKVRGHINKLSASDNLLWKTDEHFDQKGFRTYYAGAIEPKLITPYAQTLNAGLETVPKTMLRLRFEAQDMLMHTFMILSQKTGSVQ